MPLNPCEMILENKEGYTDYNIDPDWHKNRKPGISVVVRCYGEERWIGPCIESLLPLVDEILVTMTEKEADRTETIVQQFHSPKIRLFKYPFTFSKAAIRTHQTKFQRMFFPQFGGDASVHSFSYYTNWGMSKTRFTHVAPKWDPDMWLLPRFTSKEFKEFLLSKSTVYTTGYNVATADFRYLSKLWPIQGPEPRFYKVDQYKFHYGEIDGPSYQGPMHLIYTGRWVQFPVQQAQCLFNNILRRDVYYPWPVFIHTKLLGKHYRERRFIGFGDGSLDPLLMPGKQMPIQIPEFVWKTPENYLGNPSPSESITVDRPLSFDKKRQKEALKTIQTRKGELT